MKIFKTLKTGGVFDPRLVKIGRVMKLTVFFSLIVISQAVAISSYSQTTKLSLDMQNARVKDVISRIEDESEFFFLYSSKLVDVEKSVSIKADKSDIHEILASVFKGTDIEYLVMDRQIILSPKAMMKEYSEAVAQQQNVISGKVTDKTGSPLPGVTVVVKGTTQGTISSEDGTYMLTGIPDNATLVFSFVGMRTQEIPVANRSSVNVVMEEETIGLDEVVAIGYGTVKKSDLTGSVSSVKDDEIGAYPSSNLVDALKGRAAGVQVMQNNGSPGASISMRIRGTNSIMGSNEPLYVIDGVPASSRLINNADIESIEILKDASATAIYGSRGANGVVLITTKKGKKGASRIEYQSSFGIQSLVEKIDLMNATQYALLYNEQTTNDGLANHFSDSDIGSLGEGFDWQDAIYRQAPIQEHNLSISEGTEKTHFYVSGSIFKQAGIIKSSAYDRYSFRANIDHKISARLSFNGNMILTNVRKADAYSGISSSALYAYPTVTPYNDDGTFTQLKTVYVWGNDGLLNPVQQIDERSNTTKSHQQLLNPTCS